MDEKTAAVAGQLAESGRRLIRTVDSLTADQFAEPSGLPGWTRGHVVAHLALNAEGLARALQGVATGRPATMYDSDEARDRDIEEAHGMPVEDLRERFLASVATFAAACDHLPAAAWGGEVERTAGGIRFTTASIPSRRWVEVEVHHADLAAGYTHADWPAAFCTSFIPVMLRRVEAPLTLRATDSGETWEANGGGPEVSGTAADLGWWLSGRGGAERLTGDVPEMGAW